MSQFVSDVLKTVSQGQVLDEYTAESFMNHLMEGECSPIQTAGLLSAITVRGEAVSEIVGFAKAMRDHAVPLSVAGNVVDTCGTGGDGGQTFNISTAAAIVAAAAGAKVVKHGNRAVSSRSGSADVLSALGARIDLDREEASACLNALNLCFLFAPSYHPAMKYAAETRRELGFRTVFNVLGPLTNPARPKRQVLGVYRPELVSKVAEALLQLGSDHVMVVHGHGGIDELSLAGESLVAEVVDGAVKTYTVTPESVGLARQPLDRVAGGDAVVNATIIERVFNGEQGAHLDIVALNAGAVLYVSGIAGTLAEGVQEARSIVASGRAKRCLEAFIQTTHDLRRTEVAQ